MVHLEDFMVNLSRYKLSPINYKPQHQLVWSAPEWMDRKRHSRDFSPRATLFRYCLTWFRLKEVGLQSRDDSHIIFPEWATSEPLLVQYIPQVGTDPSSSLGNLVTWANWYEGRGHLTETGSWKNISCLFNFGLNRKSCFLKFPDHEWRRCGQVED